MKNIKKTMLSFRADQEFADYVAKTADCLGVRESELIRLAIDEGMASARKKLAAKLAQKAKMVRDTGFEPVTPTVSRLWASALQPAGIA